MAWRVGEVTITRITESEPEISLADDLGFWPDATADAVNAIQWLRPHFVTPKGDLRLSFHSLLVETPKTRVVVDTCVGNDKTRHMPAWNQMHSDYLEKFAEAGWTRESVRGVLCTHMHVDHVGWNTMWVDGRWVPTFPNARYYFSRQEYEFWTNKAGPYHEQLPDSLRETMESSALLVDSVMPVVDAGLVEFVESDHIISPEIRLLPTPGHSPGHVSILIESRGQRAVITGDMAHHPMQIACPAWSTVLDTDPVQARKTRFDFYERFVDTPTLVIGTHFAAPTAGRIVRDGETYRLAV
ncbi:MBL fold metallo-hydrolase [Trinickia symbiotica]|uniref:MBL fold metallo-hydrolase n=1 Tax=Trinickia symbiotica TaxID=863227 RepID=A0A2N7WL28_9BURK|nr:MBL fold metallo-hydrolase [Trinickia symbiotica]